MHLFASLGNSNTYLIYLTHYYLLPIYLMVTSKDFFKMSTHLKKVLNDYNLVNLFVTLSNVCIPHLNSLFPIKYFTIKA